MHLEQHISQFLTEIFHVLIVDGASTSSLSSFQAWFKTHGSLPVPRTTVLRAEFAVILTRSSNEYIDIPSLTVREIRAGWAAAPSGPGTIFLPENYTLFCQKTQANACSRSSIIIHMLRSDGEREWSPKRDTACRQFLLRHLGVCGAGRMDYQRFDVRHIGPAGKISSGDRSIPLPSLPHPLSQSVKMDSAPSGKYRL